MRGWCGGEELRQVYFRSRRMFIYTELVSEVVGVTVINTYSSVHPFR